MKRILPILLSLFAATLSPPITSAAFLTFDLGAPVVTPTSATIAVGLTFNGAAGDQIEALQLSMVGSSAALTGGNFSRFSFTPNATTLAGWTQLAGFSPSGFNLLAPDDPVAGPFLTPSGSAYNLGVLTVDLTGIAGGQNMTVTLAGGVPGTTGTDAGGTIGGTFYPSFATAGSAVSLRFAQSGGVTFGTVPEPSSLLLIGLGATILAGARRLLRASPAVP